MILERAINYRCGLDYGYKHAVGPYYELNFEELDSGHTVNSFWHVIEGDPLMC